MTPRLRGIRQPALVAMRFGALVFVLLGVVSGSAYAQPSASDVPAAARASPDFDPEAATRAYLDTVPAEARARSDAYFEGGYWLQLVNLLVYSRFSSRSPPSSTATSGCRNTRPTSSA